MVNDLVIFLVSCRGYIYRGENIFCSSWMVWLMLDCTLVLLMIGIGSFSLLVFGWFTLITFHTVTTDQSQAFKLLNCSPLTFGKGVHSLTAATTSSRWTTSLSALKVTRFPISAGKTSSGLLAFTLLYINRIVDFLFLTSFTVNERILAF